MANFHHGIINRDGEVVRPIKTNSTNVIGIIGTAGKGPLNEPQLITSFKQAVDLFGPLANDGFTLVSDIDDMLKQDNMRILAINVSPRNSLSTVSNEAVTLNNAGIGNTVKNFISSLTTTTAVKTKITLDGEGSYTFPEDITVTAIKDITETTTYVNDDEGDYEITDGVLTLPDGSEIEPRQTVVVAYTATLTANTDYTVDGDNGQITRLSGLIIGDNPTITVSYSYVPATITDELVIGEQGASINQNTGVYALFKAIAQFGLTPKLILAPSHSYTLPVSGANLVFDALLTAANKLGAVAITNTPQGLVDAIAYRNLHKHIRAYAINSFHYKTLEGTKVVKPTAQFAAALFAKSDSTRKEGTSASPSNMKINGITELVNPVEFSLTTEGTQTDLLNENGIAVIANIDGFRLWGNRSTTDDSAYSFINVIRTSDYVKDAIASSHLEFIDRNITSNYIKSLLTRLNNFLKDLVGQEVLNWGRAYENTTLNTAESKQAGTVYIDYEIGIPGIAEKLVFTCNIVNGYVANIQEIN